MSKIKSLPRSTLRVYVSHGVFAASHDILLDTTSIAACATFDTCRHSDRRRALFSLACRW